MAEKLTIICVDDEKTILDALKEQLTRNFMREYAIECAENAEKALELYKELVEENAEIPVIISDHIMPGMKGDELLKQIYLLNPRIKKILLTGQADADAVGRAVNYANLYRYISKPWEQNDLNLTVHEAIRSYFQDKTLEEQNLQLKKINENLETLNVKLEQKIILFNKFVPNQFLDILHVDLEKKAAQEPSKDAAEDHIELSQCAERELTVMFSDIRSFTSICEKLTSSEAFEFINSYLCEMGPIIREHGGFIDKFIGDAIMALFLTPEDAIKAGIAMQQQLSVYNKKLEQMGREPIAFGIGINTDTVMLGTVGEVNRLQTTVIGDAVNLAQRTEKQSKEFGTRIVVTGNTYNKLGGSPNFKFRFLDQSKVKGKQQQIDFYEVLNIFPESQQLKKLEINDQYQKGVMFFKKEEYNDALLVFEECLKSFPDDFPTQMYLSLTKEALQAKASELDSKNVIMGNRGDPTIARYMKFWGSRGSSSVSGPDYSRFGGCTSCLEIRDNDELIIFDAGSGIRALGEKILLEKNRTIHLLISHFHWDHLWGFPFFLPIYHSDYNIHIHAPGETPEDINKQLSLLFSPKFFPVNLGDLKAKISYHPLNADTPIKIGNITIDCCLAHHPGKTFCFKVNSSTLTFGYVTDNEFLSNYDGPPCDISRDNPLLDPYRDQIRFFENCELMIHEAQYLPNEYKKKKGWGHSSINNALVLIREINPKTWIVTHHDPDETDKDLIEKKNILKTLLNECSIGCTLEFAEDGMSRPL